MVLPDGVHAPGWLAVEGERVAALGAGVPPRTPDVNCEGLWLTPGFVDMHVHGGGGASFAGGAEDIRHAAEFHRRHGSTSIVASLVTAPLAELERQVGKLAQAVASGVVDGIHLEGPWLSDVRRGAHDRRHLRTPGGTEVLGVLEAGGGAVRMVTLAPELPGGLEVIKTLAERGVVAAIGHTDATYEQTRAAIAAGATVATHLFNAMAPLHQREPGPILALLEDRRVTLEVIADGLHVHNALLRWLVHTAGPGRVALVTDAISAAGAADGQYALGGLQVVVRNGEARLAEDSRALAGSTLSMAAAVQHAVSEFGLGVESAARMASQVPARAVGLSDAGEIRVGARADLVLLDDTGRLVATMWRGSWVVPPPTGR